VSNLNKKQVALTLVIVAFAAAMVISTVVSATGDNLAFAKHHKHKKHKHHSNGGHNHTTAQTKSQSNVNKQNVICQASGGVSIGQGTGGILGTGIAVTPNAGTNLCFNANSNTNADTGSQNGATS
jgi:mannitol-specific phosphotransferase system IIBC component